MSNVIDLNTYADDLKKSEKHTTTKKNKEGKIYTFYIANDDIDLIEDLIYEKGENQVSTFIRNAIEKAYDVKFKNEYSNKKRRKRR